MMVGGIFLSLIFISFTNALVFYILINKKVEFKEAFRLISVAVFLNKIFFSGSGYFATSYLSKNKHLSFSKVIGIFFVIEFLGISFWLILGVYFGAKIAIKIPWGFLGVSVIFLIFLLWKRKKLVFFTRNILDSFKNLSKRVIIVLPFVFLNILFLTFYYYSLFNIFNFTPSFLDILRIISVSFTIGYLSPAPAGLGFKEGGMVFLLMRNGLDFNGALAIALWDRIIASSFWGILGVVMGYNIIKDEFKRRLYRR